MSYSGVDQKRVSDFVNDNVYMNATDIVNDLIDCGKIELENVIQYKAEYDGEEITEEQAQNMIESFEEDLSSLEDEYRSTTDEFHLNDIKQSIDYLKVKIEELEDLDFDEPTEVLEYYFVTDFFANELEDKGEIIIDEYQAKIWGRTCSGQAIFLDGVVIEIAKENRII